MRYYDQNCRLHQHIQSTYKIRLLLIFIFNLEITVVALKALANVYIYTFTMSFLNCIEKADQNGLVYILPYFT